MKLVFRNAEGETVSLEIGEYETFHDLRTRVEQEIGITLDLERIERNGRKVVETERILEYFANTAENVTETSLRTEVECCVPGCGNTKSSNIEKSFFQLPKDELHSHKWVMYCQRLAMVRTKEHMTITPQSTICSDHFLADQYIKDTTVLKRTAVPSINPELPSIERPSTSHEYGAQVDEGATPPGHARKAADESVCSDSDIEEICFPGSGHSTPPASGTINVCRLCAKHVKDGVYIYGPTGIKMKLGAKINACLPMRVDMTDDKPKQVCRDCIASVEYQCKFIRKVIDTDEFLKKLHSRAPNQLDLGSLLEKKFKDVPEEYRSLFVDELGCPFCNGSFNYINVLQKEPEEESEPELSNPRTPKLGSNIDTQQFKCNSCSTVVTGFSHLLNHCLDHFDNDLYKCILCRSTHSTEQALVVHLITHLSKPNYFSDIQRELIKDCEICSTFEDLQEPINTSEYTCPTSETSSSISHPSVIVISDDDIEYMDIDDVEKQSGGRSKSSSNPSSVGDQQREKPYSCKSCGKNFIRKGMLRNHMATMHKKTPQKTPCFACRICDEAFQAMGLVNAHFNSNHESDLVSITAHPSCQPNSPNFHIVCASGLFKCEYCERHFAEINSINKHREKHVGNEPYSCRCCPMVFPSYWDLVDHKSTHKDEDMPAEYQGVTTLPVGYLCKYCDRCLQSYEMYKEHETVHFGSEPYQCRYCSLDFSTSHEMKYHRLMHEDCDPFSHYDVSRPYECHYCSKCFTVKDTLAKHIRMHTGEKPFQCDQCNKCFSQSSGLNTHKKTHSNARPYACPHCPSTFKIKGDRDMHAKVHSGNRPFTCIYCDKTFMTQRVCSEHMKIHTGERPYRCETCNSAFRRSHDLTVHRRIHTGDKPNVCDICGKTYRQRSDMLKHRRTKHSSTSPQAI